ncbi:2-oxo acid dehydrogenase subunit E2 [Streptomyces sp. NPDC093094]|uniref:2-oxo acid dehydrogenase subunit E2 n=1 Tax=Streptomyces sp. NPDC093094 TaxID=3366026 RepID=UPI00381DF2B6
MPASVILPSLGESVTEGVVTRWLKAEGDHVEADEPLLEVSTDKVDTEIPAPASGVLVSIAVGEDETVEIGALLGLIAEPGEATATPPPAPAAAPAPAPAAPVPASTPAPVVAVSSPAPTPAAPGADRTPVVLPTLGESVTEGTVTRWLKNVGDAVAEDEPLLEVSTDKVDTEIPAPVGGVLLEILVGEDETAEVGSRLAVIGVSVPATAPAAGSPAPAETPAPSITPPAPAPAPAPAPTPAPAPAPAPAAGSSPGTAGSSLPRGRTEPLSRMRKVIAENMVRALHTSAQLTSVVEADVTALMRLRDRVKDAFAAREGIRLSPMPFIVRAAVETLVEHPVLNASIDTDAGTITYHDAEHIGIAVDTERGLMVPVIHDAGGLDVPGLAKRIADLAARTRQQRIKPDELSGATFTVTDTGSRGALFDTPVFTPPQVAILAIGATVKRPVVREHPEAGTTIAVRDMVYLSLSYDHRLVDGADAARFLSALKGRLEAADFDGSFTL